MYEMLKGMRVVEGASFVAAPSCCLHLLQLGAEVIRFDMIGGGPDFRRWPCAPNGASLYWEGLNKGKKSIAIDLKRPEGRQLAVALATAPGEQAGLFVTNYPAGSFLSHERLRAIRKDMITLRVMGWADGRNALDYTVNAAIGLPLITGPTACAADEPVNHVLPAWDIIAGTYAAFALLAAERNRRATGVGREVRVPLSDVAAVSLGNLGQIAEVQAWGRDRPRMGNDLYGSFGRDFSTSDARRVMIVAVTARQWKGLIEALAIGQEIAVLERDLGVRFEDEGQRFRHRARLFPLVEAATSRRTLADLASAFDQSGVCWSVYRTLSSAVTDEHMLVSGNPLFSTVAHPSGECYPTPGAMGTFGEMARAEVLRAPRLGEHTDWVLSEVMGLSSGEIGRLHDDGLVASADN
jgi:2-methylfumaryl-CoA isomerase